MKSCGSLYGKTARDEMSTGGEVANALVCKTNIRGFNSLPVLQSVLPQALQLPSFLRNRQIEIGGRQRNCTPSAPDHDVTIKVSDSGLNLRKSERCFPDLFSKFSSCPIAL
jgi:hypothetical protein